MQVLAGIDVGTTSVKVVLIGLDGSVLADGREATSWNVTADGVETDADAITTATRAALRQALDRLVAAHDPGPLTVTGIGIASMAESGVLVDRTGTPVAPIIAWHDHRDQAELLDLQDSVGASEFSVRTGLPTWTQWSLTKHRWLVEHVPAVGAATRRFNIAEWIVRSLGGAEVTEQSLASRTGWLDLRTRGWWAESLAWSRASASLLPELVTAGTPTGRASGADGLPEIAGAVLTVAGHDHQAASIAAGAIHDGDELDSCGTAEAIVRTIPAGLPDAAVAALTAAGVTVGWHALADKWCLLAGTRGGLLLQQVLTHLAVAREGLPALDALALAAPGGTSSLVLDDAGELTSVAGSTDAGSVWRAATEAVTADAARLSAVLTEHAGARNTLIVTGGWTNSAALMAAKSAALGQFRLAPAGETGARGAALLAGLAAGVYSGYADFPPAGAGLPQ